MLEAFYGPCYGSEILLIISAWIGVRGIVSTSDGGVSSHSFGDIVSLPQTDMTWIVCWFCKELKYYEIIL